MGDVTTGVNLLKLSTVLAAAFSWKAFLTCCEPIKSAWKKSSFMLINRTQHTDQIAYWTSILNHACILTKEPTYGGLNVVSVLNISKTKDNMPIRGKWKGSSFIFLAFNFPFDVYELILKFNAACCILYLKLKSTYSLFGMLS